MNDLSQVAATNEEFSRKGNCFREQTPPQPPMQSRGE